MLLARASTSLLDKKRISADEWFGRQSTRHGDVTSRSSFTARLKMVPRRLYACRTGEWLSTQVDESLHPGIHDHRFDLGQGHVTERGENTGVEQALVETLGLWLQPALAGRVLLGEVSELDASPSRVDPGPRISPGLLSDGPTISIDLALEGL
jgi:hypothetical protein